MPHVSSFVEGLTAETAFTVLAAARRLKETGKEVVELEIGDSPFPSTPAAKAAGIKAIERNQTGYCPSMGLMSLRTAAAEALHQEFGVPVESSNIVVASGAKPFEAYFVDALLEPGDGVLVFSPHFPTYLPNIERRGCRAVLAPLAAEHAFRPRAEQVERFLATDPRPRGIFLNSPHNPTGGVALRSDLEAIADLIRSTDVAVFSDEPYCHMIWQGKHESIAALPGMLERTVAAYTFSKSYSMSGWRIGFAAAAPAIADAIGKLINVSASCAPPFVQLAAEAALKHDEPTRSEYMSRFRHKVERLAAGLTGVDGVKVAVPTGTFYVFPDVRTVCDRLGITSHGLAMYLLEGADDRFGVACLGGESFGDAGAGFLRFSCAETDEKIDQALAFLPDAFSRVDRVREFLETHPKFRLKSPYLDS